MLEERNQVRRDREELVGGDVHQGHLLAGGRAVLAVSHAHPHHFGCNAPVRVERLGRLHDDLVVFLDGAQITDLVRHHAVLHDIVRGLDEPELVDFCIRGERHDQADVRPFRGLDRAHPAVVGRMNVSDLEHGPLPGKSSRAQRREPALVGDRGQRVRLVHELAELAGAEELTDHRAHGLRVDEVVGHHGLHVLEAHALLDGPLHPHQADAVLVFQQLAHRAHPAVGHMIDVVDGPALHTVLELEQIAYGVENVLFPQHGRLERGLLFRDAQLLVYLHPADPGKVVIRWVEEQVLEEVGGYLQRRGVGRPEPPVDLDDSLFRGVHLVQRERLGQ